MKFAPDTTITGKESDTKKSTPREAVNLEMQPRPPSDPNLL
jgi:hypothetical protein